MLAQALLVFGLCAVSSAQAANALVIDLQRRLVATNVSVVNAYLSANWETKMARLGRLVRICDRGAIGLSVQLLETTNLEAMQSHIFNLELATGRCPELVLPIIAPKHVGALCAVNAYMELHPEAKPLVELERRMAHISRSPILAGLANGNACIDAYSEVRLKLK